MSNEPNAVWTVDFKGWFRTGDGSRCDPLTLSDSFSRYLLRCQTVARPDHDHVQPVFEEAFCEFGRPWAIRSDNGPPFASTAAGGLSALSVWWIKLDIAPERIEPAKPQQNGRHERMHRTLRHDTAKPPAASLAEQQARFDAFCRIYTLRSTGHRRGAIHASCTSRCMARTARSAGCARTARSSGTAS